MNSKEYKHVSKSFFQDVGKTLAEINNVIGDISFLLLEHEKTKLDKIVKTQEFNK